MQKSRSGKAEGRSILWSFEIGSAVFEINAAALGVGRICD